MDTTKKAHPPPKDSGRKVTSKGIRRSVDPYSHDAEGSEMSIILPDSIYRAKMRREFYGPVVLPTKGSPTKHPLMIIAVGGAPQKSQTDCYSTLAKDERWKQTGNGAKKP